MSSTTTLLGDQRREARRGRGEPEGRTPRGEIRGRPAAERVPKTGGSFLFEPVVEKIFTRELFSDEQRQIDEMVRQLAEEKILPRKAELATHNEELTRELLREVAELGLTGIDVPEKYGGVELDKTTSALVVEALTTGGSASWVVTFSCHVGIGSLPLVFFGSEAQKAKYLPKLASAEWLGAYALTEPQAGSDALSIETTAELSDDGSGEAFVLNGTKLYVTNGGWADLYVVFAQLQGKMSAFLVERGFDGLTVGAEEEKMGIRGSSTVTLFLDNLKVPKENLLGQPGEGLPIALNVLNIGRFKLGAADLGGCKSAVDHVTGYALERKQFGQPIAFFDAIRKKLAAMVVKTYVLDSVIYRTVGLLDERISALDHDSESYTQQVMAALEDYAIEASISKVLGSETLAWIADEGLQVYGGYGFTEECPLAGVYRDTRIDRLFEGTNEINRNVIHGYFLKKALMDQLPLRQAEKTWTEAETPAAGPGWGVQALDVVRRLAVKCLHQAICLYGQDLRNEQVVGEDLADLIIAYFGASAALNRLLQRGDAATGDRGLVALGRLAVAACLEEAWRLFYRLRPTLFVDKRSGETAAIFEQQIQKLHLPFDPVAEVRVLSDDLYHHGHYRF
jgi:alkylation response protein AidB-like acyl-CoA dehydrogenase